MNRRTVAVLILLASGLGEGCARNDAGLTPAASGIFLAQEQWSAGGSNGVVMRTPRIRIFTNVPPGVLRSRLPATLEYTLAGIDRFWPGHPDPEPELEAVVYASLSEWRQAVARRFGIEPGEGLNYGAATSRGIALLHDIGPDGTLRLAAHEIWHAYAQRVLQSPLPTAMDEAIACYVEGLRWEPDADGPMLSPASNPIRRQHLALLASRGRLGSLAEHLAADPHDLAHSAAGLDDYYARAWNLGLLLLDSGDVGLKKGVQRLLEDARTGTLDSAAHVAGGEMLAWLSERYFNRSPAEMEEIWLRSAMRAIGP
ncbi:MAG: hypothetical protein Kow0022_04530 [Phycisphaerales bacterium]